MSGIAGIYQKNGAPLDSTVLRQMIDALSHRGGEGCETWGEGPVGLAIDQRKLLSEDCDYTLPLNVDDYVIVADARIDNREELLRQFDEPPHTWPHISDSLVILKSYAKWGAECPERLHGDFVFVIWDPHTKRLFCARDRIGVRPFYYVSTPELFCFASEIKALHRHPAVGRDLDEIRLANYIMARFEDKERTFYRQISR